MTALSFAPWISFTSAVPALAGTPDAEIDVPGSRLSAFRDRELIGRSEVPSEDGWCSCRVGFGDGYFTALLGLMIGGGAVAAMFFGHTARLPGLAIIAGLTALALTGYNAFAEWRALAYTNISFLEEVKGSRTAWLYLLLGVEALAAVLGAVLWGILQQDADGYDEDGPDELSGRDAPLPEGLDAWR